MADILERDRGGNMRKLTYKINALAGCNVRGRLKYIRDLLKDGEHDKALNETRCLLHFVSDRDESSKETVEPIKPRGCNRKGFGQPVRQQ